MLNALGHPAHCRQTRGRWFSLSFFRTLLSFAITLAIVLLADIPASAAVSSEQAVAFLNQQRALNGIPGDLTTDPELTLGCQQHNRYMEAEEFGHGENPDSPYYTPEGAGQGPYGGAEVLAWGDGYDLNGENPWEWAPIHLYLLLDPAQTEAGYDATHDYTCMRISGNREKDSPTSEPQFFSYPGPGTRGIYPDEYAAEWPYTPQQLVGIPEYEVTGTNILLFSLGAGGLDAESFELRGPAGAVPARMVDENTRNEVGSGSWFSGGGVIVPEKPLAEHTGYTVNVKWRNLSNGDPYSEESEGTAPQPEFFFQEFSFTTGVLSKESRERRPWNKPVLELRQLKGGGPFVRLRLTAGRSLRGHEARFAIFRQERGCGPAFGSAAHPCGWRSLGKPSLRTLRLKGTQVLRVREPRRWQKATIKVRTRQFEVVDVRFAPALAKWTIKR